MFKDTTIAAKAKKRELIILLIAFLFAFSLNVIGIIQHQTPAKELFTQLHVVLLITVVLYLFTGLLRVIYLLISRLWNRKS